MKNFSIIIAFAAALLTACANDTNSQSAQRVCVDPESGITMSQEACDLLAAERRRRMEAEEHNPNENEESETEESGSEASPNEVENEPNPTNTPAPSADNIGMEEGAENRLVLRGDYVENAALGFRFPVPADMTGIANLSIPVTPTDFTDIETIGHFQVAMRSGNHLRITVDRYTGGFTEGKPNVIPNEGYYSDTIINTANGIKGHLYLSGAMGIGVTPHITIFREDRIIYLREDDPDVEVSEELKAFARTFEVTR